MESSWSEVGGRVYVRRHRHRELNCGLVVGTDACLVIDTRCHPAEPLDLIAAIRAITPHPWTVVNNPRALGPLLRQRRIRTDQAAGRDMGAPRRRRGSGQYRHRAALGRRLHRPQQRSCRDRRADRCRLRRPARSRVHGRAELIVGGRSVDLVDLGRGHTDGDLVAEINCGADASMIFVGDPIEEDNPPGFDGACPEEWPATMGRLHGMPRGAVVPGHGAVVDADFIAAQRQELLAIAELVRLAAQDPGVADPATPDLLARSPYDDRTARTALVPGLAVRSGFEPDRGGHRDDRQWSARTQVRMRDA